jgi:predicted nucleic acid-binding protein
VNLRSLDRVLGSASLVGVDTAVLIYHLENVSPYVELTTRILGSAAAGRRLIISAVSIAEVLAGPWTKGDANAAHAIQEGLLALPGLRVQDITSGTAAAAAELRGRTSLPLPDALIVASLFEGEAQIIVTNDARWKSAKLPGRVVLLDDFLL